MMSNTIPSIVGIRSYANPQYSDPRYEIVVGNGLLFPMVRRSSNNHDHQGMHRIHDERKIYCMLIVIYPFLLSVLTLYTFEVIKGI